MKGTGSVFCFLAFILLFFFFSRKVTQSDFNIRNATLSAVWKTDTGERNIAGSKWGSYSPGEKWW